MDPRTVRRTGGALAAMLTLGLMLPAAALAGTDRSFEWSGTLERGRTIEIKSVNGSISAEPASGNRIEVSAVKTWRRSDPDEVTIEVIEHDGGITICTLYPGRGNRCGVGGEVSMKLKDNDVTVDYEVKVPRGLRFEGRTVNGDVDARDLAGPTLAKTVNGSIDLSTSDAAEAETVNGSIHVSMGAARWSDGLRFRTVNGRIDILLPADTGAQVHCSTVNGDISTDLPLEVRGKFGPRSVRGTIGGGGGDLDLETVNGGIRLRTRS
jgi:DUF4097 and DUF4098 domain-containing protein YvlB